MLIEIDINMKLPLMRPIDIKQGFHFTSIDVNRGQCTSIDIKQCQKCSNKNLFVLKANYIAT